MRAVLVVGMMAASSTLMLAAFRRPLSMRTMSRVGRGQLAPKYPCSHGIRRMAKSFRSLLSPQRYVSSTGTTGSCKTRTSAAAIASERGADMGAIQITPASLALADDLLKVINWAYRGKDGVEAWTGEAHLLSGVRIQSEDLHELLAQQQDQSSVVFAAVEGKGAGGETEENKNALGESPTRVVGSIHALLRDDGCAEFGLFSVDPSYQSRGIGAKLLDAAESHAREKWNLSEAKMFLLEQRKDLYGWYSRRGYLKTGVKVPFPVDAIGKIGKPIVSEEMLVFEELLKTDL